MLGLEALASVLEDVPEVRAAGRVATGGVEVGDAGTEEEAVGQRALEGGIAVVIEAERLGNREVGVDEVAESGRTRS